MKPITTVRLSGLALVFGAVAFLAVFSFLAARFNYPDNLDGPANMVLPSLLATGTPGRAAWALYAFLPLIWLPAGVGAYCALRRVYPGAMLLGEFLGELSFNMFFLLSSWSLLRSRTTPAWVAVVGLAVAAGGFVGMFRNITGVVAPVAAVNNYLLPLWMIGFGMVLLRHRLPDVQATS